MKYSDMNERQKKAFRNIKFAADWMLGELENSEMDGDADATKILNNHNELVETLYERAISELYDGAGSMIFGAAAENTLKDIRFCSKDWLMERCDKRITKEGY